MLLPLLLIFVTALLSLSCPRFRAVLLGQTHRIRLPHMQVAKEEKRDDDDDDDDDFDSIDDDSSEGEEEEEEEEQDVEANEGQGYK